MAHSDILIMCSSSRFGISIMYNTIDSNRLHERRRYDVNPDGFAYTFDLLNIKEIEAQLAAEQEMDTHNEMIRFRIPTTLILGFPWYDVN